MTKSEYSWDHTYFYQVTDRRLDLEGESLSIYEEIDESMWHASGECFSENPGVAFL